MSTMTITIERTPRTLQFGDTTLQAEELSVRLPFARKPADLTDLLVIEDDHLVCPQTPHDTLQVGNVAQPLGQSIAHRIGDQTGTFGALLVGQNQNSFHERYSLQYTID